MNTKESAQWLADFYQQVADGREMQVRSNGNKWHKAEHGPCFNNIEKFRIKPKTQKIDRHHFIESKIDCEFYHAQFGTCLTKIGCLAKQLDSESQYKYITDNGAAFSDCKPRMSPYVYFWQGGKCPLPDGVEVMVHLRDGSTVSGNACDFQWEHGFGENDTIGFEIVGLLEGWEW